MIKITQIWFNWHQFIWDGEAGEKYQAHKVGENGVIKITENIPGDVYAMVYFEVHFEDGRIERIYNANRVFFR